MTQILGTTPGLFFVVTIVMFGWAAWHTGQVLAQTWRPYGYAILYGAMLAAADRLMVVLLFEGRLFAPVPYLLTLVILVGLASLAFRLTQVRKMVGQYPWIYERDGLFGWRERS